MPFPRMRLSSKHRAAFYEAARPGEGKFPVCPRCRMPVFTTDRWHAGHELSPLLGGRLKADQVEHARCNLQFAATYEVPLIRKNARVALRAMGAFRSANPMPGGRDDWRKRTMAGRVVLRPWAHRGGQRNG